MRKATVSFFMYVCPSAWNNSAPIGRIFIKFYIIFRKFAEEIQGSKNLTRITRNLHENARTRVILCRRTLLSVTDISDKSCRQNQNFFFQKIAPFTR